MERIHGVSLDPFFVTEYSGLWRFWGDRLCTALYLCDSRTYLSL